MNFYEKLRRENHEKKLKSKRIFKDPEACVKRFEDLTDSEFKKEVVFLIANLAEKIGEK